MTRCDACFLCPRCEQRQQWQQEIDNWYQCALDAEASHAGVARVANTALKQVADLQQQVATLTEALDEHRKIIHALTCFDKECGCSHALAAVRGER